MSKIAIALAIIGVTAGVSIAEARNIEQVTSVKTAKGRVLANEKGMTLYTFDEDANGKSSCTWFCAVVWPPLKASADAPTTGHWGILARGGGVMQLSYKGRPLYTYVKDAKPGDATGDGVEGTWHIARP